MLSKRNEIMETTRYAAATLLEHTEMYDQTKTLTSGLNSANTAYSLTNNGNKTPL